MEEEYCYFTWSTALHIFKLYKVNILNHLSFNNHEKEELHFLYVFQMSFLSYTGYSHCVGINKLYI